MSEPLNQSSSKISRRALLRAAAGTTLMLTGGVAVLLQGCSTQKTTQSVAPSGKAVTSASATFTPDVELALTATQSTAQILSGAPTTVWTYRGEVLKGAANVLQTIPNAYLGPIIRVRQGQKVRIHFKNDLPEDSIIHWHGLIVPPEMDGHPKDAVGPGQTYVYEFEVKNRAGTYWYHPHPHGRTGYQVNAGLAGLFIVSDDEEAALALPQGDADLPLVIQDRLFDDNQQFAYVSNRMGSMMDRMMGFLGDKFLVNGQADFHLSLATRVYRLRLLNGSNSRIYKLAWSNGLPMTVIATDGGLLEKPVQRDYVMLAPAERVELWVDLRKQAVGTELKLQSLAYTGVEAGKMGGMTGGESALPNGEPFDILTVRVAKAEAEPLALPAKLSTLEPYRVQDAVNRNKPRQIVLGMSSMNWTLNGKTFEMEAVTREETVKLGSLEVWEFINEMNMGGMNMSGGNMAGMDHGKMGNSMMQGNMANQGGMMDFMAHPIHMHGVQFQVVGREVAVDQMADWQTVKDGFVDDGWKDTVLVMPGERVKLVMRFADYPGLYLYHCHNLEHEDMGMMRNYLIKA